MSKDSMLVKLLDDEQFIEYKQRDELLTALNMPTPEPFIKNHPTAKGVRYVPIDKVEFLLTKIYQKWRVEVLRESVMANAIHVTIRLHYFDPLDHEWDYQDGVGAMDLQTRSGAKASDLLEIVPGAVQKALPAAKSYAVKDAAEQLGKIFGRDLNRKDTLAYDPGFAGAESEQRINAIKENAVSMAKEAHEVSDTTAE